MKKNVLPIILTNSKKSNKSKRSSKANFDFSNINSFGTRFQKLKQELITINLKPMKKSLSNNEYDEVLKEKPENEKRNLFLEHEVYGADYLSKFKKIKLDIYKNRFIKKERNNLFSNRFNHNNRYDRRLSIINENDLIINELEKNFYCNEIKPKNEIQYDIDESNEVDSDDEIELEPERDKYNEIKSTNQNEKSKKSNSNIKTNILT